MQDDAPPFRAPRADHAGPRGVNRDVRRPARAGPGSWPLPAPGPDGYTSGMKTAISLPDAVFRDAERLARRLKKSRSELYREAVAEYLARHEPEAVTEALDRLAAKVDTRPDGFSSAAARRVLGRSEW